MFHTWMFVLGMESQTACPHKCCPKARYIAVLPWDIFAWFWMHILHMFLQTSLCPIVLGAILLSAGIRLVITFAYFYMLHQLIVLGKHMATLCAHNIRFNSMLLMLMFLNHTQFIMSKCAFSNVAIMPKFFGMLSPEM